MDNISKILKEIKKIKINNKNYSYIFCNTIELLIFLRNNIKYKKSFVKIMKAHRNKYFDLIDLIIENYNYSKQKKKIKYLIIFNKTQVVGISRIIFYNKEGFINMVHTNIKFRGRGFCQFNIKKIIELSNKKHKLKTFKLEVDTDNYPAIKAYQKCGFNKTKKIKDKFGERYLMIKNIK